MMDYEKYFLSRDKYKDVYPFSNLIKQSFVRYYEIKDKRIYVHTTYKILVYPYSKDIEKEILEKMKTQIKEWEINLKQREYDKLLFYLFIFNSFSQYCLTFEKKSWLNFICGTLWLISANLKGIPYIKDKIKLNDIQKHNLFLENEEKIKEIIKLEMIKQGIVDNNAINLTPAFESYMTINDVHFLNRHEIKNIINGNISRDLIYKLKKD